MNNENANPEVKDMRIEEPNPETVQDTVPEEPAKRKLISVDMDPKVKRVLKRLGVGALFVTGMVGAGYVGVKVARTADAKHYKAIIEGLENKISELTKANVPAVVEQAAELIAETPEVVAAETVNVFDNI